MNNPLAGTDPSGYRSDLEKTNVTQTVAVTGSHIKIDPTKHRSVNGGITVGGFLVKGGIGWVPVRHTATNGAESQKASSEGVAKDGAGTQNDGIGSPENTENTNSDSSHTGEPINYGQAVFDMLEAKRQRQQAEQIRQKQLERHSLYDAVQDLIQDLGEDGVVFGKRKFNDDGTPSKPPSEHPPGLGDDDEWLHEQVFFTERDARGELVLRNRGFFGSDTSGNADINGMIRPENFPITDQNIGNYRFGKIYTDIPKSRIYDNPTQFSSGTYDLLDNNCQHYCTFIRGSKN